MQGVQSAMQQVSQLGNASGEEPLTDQQSADDASRAEYVKEEPGRDQEQRAEPGDSGAEHVPESGGTGESPSEAAPLAPPRKAAPTRPAEVDGGINL